MRPLSEAPMTGREDVLSWWGDTTGAEGAQIRIGPDGRLAGMLLGDAELLIEALGVRGIGEEPYRPDHVRVEVDEIETSGRCAGVDVRVRHNFDRHWQVRIGLTNPTDQPLPVDRLMLDVRPGPEGLLQVHAAGALAFLTFHRFGTPRCLALRLTRGDLIADEDGIGTPRLELAPGGRYQLVLSGEWYAEPQAVRQRYPVWFPDSLDRVAADRVDPLIDHPDTAVLIKGDHDDAPDLERLEVADARGVTWLDVAYADEERTFARLARHLAAAGALSTAAEGLIVLRAMPGHHLAHDEAAGLIEAYLDRPGDDSSPLRALLLVRAREWLVGTGGLTERAAAELADLPPGPGVPLAWLHLWASGQLVGHEPEIAAVVDRLSGAMTDQSLDPVTLAELRLMVSGGAPELRARLARALREVDLMCTLTHGELWPRRSDADLARAVVVHSLLRPAQGREMPDAHRCVRRLIARAPLAPDGLEALAWLTLRAPTA
ncbi:MAG: hypothetical protein Q4F67_11345 [Propionibacteriaceae bacterium]|nr:hypothetical protein [Propionibacteriaceae bacterium]